MQSGEHGMQVPFEGTEVAGQRLTHWPLEAKVGGGHWVQLVLDPTQVVHDPSHPVFFSLALLQPASVTLTLTRPVHTSPEG